LRAKLRQRSIRPYKFIKGLNPIAYRLDLPIYLKHMHNVFLTSQHRQYDLDVDHALLTKSTVVNEGLVFEEYQVQILDRRIK